MGTAAGPEAVPFAGYTLSAGPDVGAEDVAEEFADLVVAEKRIERILRERERKRAHDPGELAALGACCEKLDEGIPLRRVPELATSPHLRSFSFLSAKPLLALCNNGDEDGAVGTAMSVPHAEHRTVPPASSCATDIR